jgi:hypothetical protein
MRAAAHVTASIWPKACSGAVGFANLQVLVVLQHGKHQQFRGVMV